jgi:hypothetical protein
LQDRDKVRRVNQGFLLDLIGGAEFTFIRPVSEHLDPRLHRWVHAEGNRTSSRLNVEAKAQRFQNAVKPDRRVHALKLTQ